MDLSLLFTSIIAFCAFFAFLGATIKLFLNPISIEINSLKIGQEKMDQEIKGLKAGQERLDKEMNSLKIGQERLDKKLDNLESLILKAYKRG